MEYHLTIIQKPKYLHAIVTGENTKENVARYLNELYEECKARKCSKVLMEEQLAGPRIDISDVFSIIDTRSNQITGMFEALAFVDTNARGDLMHFAETVARNRGLPLSVFSNVADAENWLHHVEDNV